MYTHFTLIFMAIIRCSLCYSNYYIFQGFDKEQSNLETIDTTDLPRINLTTISEPMPVTIPSANNTERSTVTTTITISSTTSQTTAKKNIKPKVSCPKELPINIGSYEVPTEKDIAMFTKDLLLSMFDAYERDAMTLLMDIKEVTKAATSLHNKCPYNQQAYKQCVKRVSGQSESVTKSLVNSLQLEKMDVKALTDDAICSLSEMKSDPMSLIKLLAQETVMLKFALPAFLRLLHSCSELCSLSPATKYVKKPLHRMTDQELVVKHFLTNKNYNELIKDSRRSI